MSTRPRALLVRPDARAAGREVGALTAGRGTRADYRCYRHYEPMIYRPYPGTALNE